MEKLAFGVGSTRKWIGSLAWLYMKAVKQGESWKNRSDQQW